MSEYHEDENSCIRCLRNSPVASLLGFIIVLIGGGAFGGSIIVARRYLINLLDDANLFNYLDYVVYGLIGLVGLFSLLAYLICTLSSGSNAKRCFESSRKSICGRCCNMTLVICLIFGVILWIAIACIISYPLISISLLHYRNKGPERLSLSGLKGTILDREKRLTRLPAVGQNFDSVEATHVQLDNVGINNLLNSDSAAPGDVNIETAVPMDRVMNTVAELEANFPDEQLNEIEQPGINLPIEQFQPILDKAKEMNKQRLSLVESAKRFFTCNPDLLDLSYYGIYDKNGLALTINRKKFEVEICNVFICVCIALAGIFLMVLGHLQILICTAINFARMQEPRYYDVSDTDEEGVALQQSVH